MFAGEDQQSSLTTRDEYDTSLIREILLKSFLIPCVVKRQFHQRE